VYTTPLSIAIPTGALDRGAVHSKAPVTASIAARPVPNAPTKTTPFETAGSAETPPVDVVHSGVHGVVHDVGNA
jgi:hypothetical protein